METEYNLNRFLEAQDTKYNDALSEIKNGKKQTHWMWYIFPQIAGLGFTDFNRYYSILNKEEATQYRNHHVLGKRLIEITNAVAEINGKTALEIFSRPDEIKLKSCMTLFALIKNPEPIFQSVLDKYYLGKKDPITIQLLVNQQ
jgi:uncharacterized protein (DUF1810 family)